MEELIKKSMREGGEWNSLKGMKVYGVKVGKNYQSSVDFHGGQSGMPSVFLSELLPHLKTFP